MVRRSRDVRNEGEQAMVDPFLEFDLNPYIEQLMEEAGTQRGFRSKTLVKSPELSIVLIVIRADSHIKEHSAPGRISVLTISGHIRMQVGDKSVDLPSNHVLALEPGIVHDVRGVQDSAFLLTLAAPQDH